VFDAIAPDSDVSDGVVVVLAEPIDL